MRRHLAADLPLLMASFPGLKPWDLDRMTFREIQGLLDHVRAMMKEGAGG